MPTLDHPKPTLNAKCFDREPSTTIQGEGQKTPPALPANSLLITTMKEKEGSHIYIIYIFTQYLWWGSAGW